MDNEYWGDPGCLRCGENPHPFADCEICIEYKTQFDLKAQHTSGAKLDNNKLDLSLLQLLGNALNEVCLVMDYGQTKYTRGGFLNVPEAPRRYTAAMLRHWLKERIEVYDCGDPFYDTEKGLPFKGRIRHDAQVAVNALFRLECTIREEQIDVKLCEQAERMAEQQEDFNE